MIIGKAVDVNHSFDVANGHYIFMEHGLIGLLGFGGPRMLPLGTLSLGLWFIIVDSIFTTGYQNYNYSSVGGYSPNMSFHLE